MIDTIRTAKTFWNISDKSKTTFEQDLAFHLASEDGLIFNYKGTLIFARPVRLDKPDLWESYTNWPIEECSAWYIWLAIGEAKLLLTLMEKLAPELPYIVRKNKKDKFQIIPTEKLEGFTA